MIYKCLTIAVRKCKIVSGIYYLNADETMKLNYHEILPNLQYLWIPGGKNINKCVYGSLTDFHGYKIT